MTKKICCLSSVLLVLPLLCFAQTMELYLDKPTKHTIAPGDTQVFELDLQKEEFVFIRFEQQGADIAIEVIDPLGKSIEVFDGTNGNRGPELVHVLPTQSGRHTLKVESLDYQKRPGHYAVQIDQKTKKPADKKEQLDQLIQYWASQGYLPGFATAIVTKNQVLFQKAYGFANLQQQQSYTTETIQNIGSVSKTLIGLSLMKAIEDGKFTLDSPINNFLPFKVVNPHHSNQPITIRHLANHTSSIAEGSSIGKTYLLEEPFRHEKGTISKREYRMIKKYAKNEARSLGDFLQAVLSQKGKWYKKKHFLKEAPGERHYYSNAGAALAAYIIEIVYQMPYREFTKQYILDKLEMSHSGWSFAAIDQEKHTDLHFQNKKVLPKYSLITYPEGGLLTNIIDLSKYLQSQLRGYYGEAQLLKPESYQTMMSAQLKDTQYRSKKNNYGIFWELRSHHIGHNGGDPGAVCLLRFNAETGVGRILLTNIIPSGDMANKQFNTIWKWLDTFGELMQGEAF